MSQSFSSALEDSLKGAFVGVLRAFIRKEDLPLPPSEEVRSILVVRQHDQLGDMLCAVPFLRHLRSRYPGGRITLVAGPVNAPIMRHHPFVDTLLEFPRGSPGKLPGFLYALRSRRYDLAFVPSTVSTSVTSALLPLLARARLRVGPSSLNGNIVPTAFCFNHPVALDWTSAPSRHQILRNLDLLPPVDESLGLETTIGFAQAELDEADKILEPLRARSPVLIGIHPGAGKQENRWGREHYLALAAHLAENYRAGLIITAGPQDNDLLSTITGGMPAGALILDQWPLRLVAAVISRLDLFISNDTGIMHVAGATPAPLLALFGPTDPSQWAPPGAKNRFLRSPSLSMNDLSFEQVRQAVDAILSAAHPDLRTTASHM